MEYAYFLAANSGRGFYSLYSEFPDEKVFLHIIKGGPGTGKSGFMRKIAAQATERGMDTELIYCSGDPDSLDGLYIPQLKQAWMDGTAPHVREPELFGVDSDYVNLGSFCAVPLKVADAGRAAEINRSYKKLYASAYAFLAEEAAVDAAGDAEPPTEKQLEELRLYVREILDKAAVKSGALAGRQSRRFISAISCKGEQRLKTTVKKLCKQYYCVDEPHCSQSFLNIAAETAREQGIDTILCPKPLRPEQLEAIVLPDLGICFCDDKALGENLTKCIDLGGKHGVYSQESDICEKLRAQATECLAKAKRLHDDLELIYRPYMDYDALNVYTQEYITRIFGRIM